MPKGSKTAIVDKFGKARLIDARGPQMAAYRAWRRAVTEAAALAARGLSGPLDGPLEATLVFWMPHLTSDPYRTLHRSAPDLDKLVRAVLDPLTEAKVIHDDARLSHIDAWALQCNATDPPGVDVELVALGWLERATRASRIQAARLARTRAT